LEDFGALAAMIFVAAYVAAVRALGSEARAVLEDDNAEKLTTNLRERRKMRNT
jgi:hypothetical protein